MKLKGKSKLIILAVAIILIAFILYKLLFDKASSWEKSAQKQLVDYFANNANKAALTWVLPIADDIYSGKEDIGPEYYLINGKVTLPGAFMAAYGRTYAKRYDYEFKIDPLVFHKEISRMFEEIKVDQER